jgi:hypothetical protein
MKQKQCQWKGWGEAEQLIMLRSSYFIKMASLLRRRSKDDEEKRNADWETSENINQNLGSAGAEKQIGRGKCKVKKRECCRMRAEDKDGGKVNYISHK